MKIEFNPKQADAQKLVDSALAEINKARRCKKDGGEFVFEPKYKEAQAELLKILYNVPEKIRRLCIKVMVPVCPKTPESELDYLNRNLRNLLIPLLASASDFSKPLSFSFVILPPQRPTELKKLSWGSRARELSEEVIETLLYEVKADTVLLTVNPLGEPITSPGRNLKALNFPVPLQFVESINLEVLEKPLTPYLERDSDGSLSIHSIKAEEL